MPKRKPSRADRLLAEAERQWPYVRAYNPAVVESPDTRNPYGGFMETWLPGDEGAPELPRPAGIPMERVGIELYEGKPAQPLDIAAEMLHADPFSQYTRGALSLSPSQQETLKGAAEDYRASLDQGEQRAMQNAIDSALRGYVFNQWPASANAEMQYDPRQRALLDLLQKYTQTGVYPLDFDLARMK